MVAGTGLDTVNGGRYADGATAVLLTKSIAEQVFGTAGAALGQDVRGSTFGHGRVTGVVRDFAFRGSWVPAATSIAVVAAEPITAHELVYVMRRAGGRRAEVVEAATRALADTADAGSTVVVKGLDRNATRFSTISRGAVVIALWTGFLVVAVALAGSLALASFSVAERSRQIGVRRALGASRGEIVRYFLFENLILTGFGLGLGLGLAVALNQVLRRIMPDLRLTPEHVLISMAIFIATGLLSALVPARRAAAIPPWAATRSL
jgi:putative ABC transport system permease protein